MAGASYLFAVTPPWRASALPVARPRVASANAAIPRLRADLDAIATGGRARTATEARRAMRVPLGVQEKYLCREARGLKSLVGLWTVWNSRLETGDGVERRARRDSPTRKATEPRDARDRKPSSALSTPPLGSRACASTGHHGDERRDTLARYVESRVVRRFPRTAVSRRARGFPVSFARRPRHAILATPPDARVPRCPATSHQACSACSRPPLPMTNSFFMPCTPKAGISGGNGERR